MKLIKLTEKGIAHYILPIAVVLGLAIAGTGYLVSSHADTLTTYAATCTINHVPSKLASTASIIPSVTITNTGTGVISPHMISFVSTNNGPTTYFLATKFGTINPGVSATQDLLLSYSPSLKTSPSGLASVSSHSDLNFNGSKVYFECSKAFTIN